MERLFRTASVTAFLISLLIHPPIVSPAEGNPQEIIAVALRNWPPQFLTDEKTGKPAGFAVDIMKEVAQMSDLKVRYIVHDNWPDAFEAIKNNRAVLAPNMGITDERRSLYDFTAPYETFRISIFVRKAAVEINKVDDLAGRKVGVVEKNQGLVLMREQGGSDLQVFNSMEESFMALLSGGVDALVYPEQLIMEIAMQSGLEDKIKIVGEPLQEIKRGIAVRKGEPELFQKLDNAVRQFIKTPEYRKIYEKWYGKPEPFWNVTRVMIVMGTLLCLSIAGMLAWRYVSILRLNRILSGTVVELKKTEDELRRYRARLEELVQMRTTELENKNLQLEQANIRLQELDRLKAMFIASMSHELRTPLNSIIGFTGIILQGMSGKISPEQRDQLNRVYRSGKHLLALINDVIDISKIEAGKIDILAEEFDLNVVIQEALSTLKPEIEEKGLDLHVSIPPGLSLRTDRKRLLQCILNYLNNAVKYTERGEITLYAGEIDGSVEISVEDTGIGIEEEDLPEVFKPFTRLDSPLRTVTLGTGLGLYLTKKLATEALQGSVSVKSRFGEGSTFGIRIPMDLMRDNGTKEGLR